MPDYSGWDFLISLKLVAPGYTDRSRVDFGTIAALKIP